MSLTDDITLAQQLLDEPLSSDSRPTEKEAQAAARRVLEAVVKDLLHADCGNLTTAGIIVFLLSLANALDPDGIEEIARSVYTRKIVLVDTSKGIEKTRATLGKYFGTAAEVYLLTKAGQPGTHIVADRENMDSSEISRICTRADVKRAVETWFRNITEAEAVEELGHIARRMT